MQIQFHFHNLMCNIDNGIYSNWKHKTEETLISQGKKVGQKLVVYYCFSKEFYIIWFACTWSNYATWWTTSTLPDILFTLAYSCWSMSVNCKPPLFLHKPKKYAHYLTLSFLYYHHITCTHWCMSSSTIMWPMFVLQTLKLDDQQYLGEGTCALSQVLTLYPFAFSVTS